MDLLAEGLAWLEDQRTKYLTRTVTYCRGASSVELPATVGSTEFEATPPSDEAGAVVKIEARDYLVLAEHLVLGGQPVLPAAGDQVRETEGAQTYVYEVLAPQGQPVWRYSDACRRTLRIHTKLTGTETP